MMKLTQDREYTDFQIAYWHRTLKKALIYLNIAQIDFV